MALQYIDNKLHEAKKVYKGSCSKCGKGICVGWKISMVTANSPTNKTMAYYCYDCTSNQWMKAFKLYKDHLTHNAELTGRDTRTKAAHPLLPSAPVERTVMRLLI